MKDRSGRRVLAVVITGLLVLLAVGWAADFYLHGGSWEDRMLASTYMEASPVTTPIRHRAAADALASWMGASRGGTGRVTGIATWSGGYGSHRRVIPHGLETQYIGEIVDPARNAPVRFSGWILDGPPSAEVGISVHDVEFTSGNLATSSSADREKVRQLLSSLIAASGLAGSYDTTRSLANAQFSGFQAVFTLIPLSAETSEGIGGIDFADGLLPAGGTISAKRY